MIKKSLIYLKSGGIKEVSTYFRTLLKKKLYYKSKTVFLYCDAQDLSNEDESPKNVQFRNILEAEQLDKYQFDRLKTLDYKKWLKGGSNVMIGFCDGTPVSFTWIHFGKYNIHDTGRVVLGDNKCWLGPTFVHKNFRGKGINKAQIQYQLNSLPDNIKYVLTSTNIENIPSLKSFERLNFVKGAILTKKMGLFNNNKSKIDFKNKGKSIFRIE